MNWNRIFDNPKKIVDFAVKIIMIFILAYVFLVVLQPMQLSIITQSLDSAKHVVFENKSTDYIQGWNDCIDYIHHYINTNITKVNGK